MSAVTLPPRRKLSKKAEERSKRLQAAEDIRLALGPLSRAARCYMGSEWYSRHVKPLVDEAERLRPSPSPDPSEEPKQ